MRVGKLLPEFHLDPPSCGDNSHAHKRKHLEKFACVIGGHLIRAMVKHLETISSCIQSGWVNFMASNRVSNCVSSFHNKISLLCRYHLKEEGV